jgi:urea transporter
MSRALIRGISRVTVEQDHSTGLYLVNADIVVRASTASDALAQVEQAVLYSQNAGTQ